MSTYEYRPNGPSTEPMYPIGYGGLEYSRSGMLPRLMADIYRVLYPFLPNYPTRAAAAGGIALWDWNLDSAIPTYGLWAGPGWAGGVRLASSENSNIDWSTPPCYNESIRMIQDNPDLDPESCRSVVDAITKTHDWMYAQAENRYARGKWQNDKTRLLNGYLSADVFMFNNIKTALETGSYTSITGIWLGDNRWGLKTYSNSLDTAEREYLKELIPAFLLKVYLSDKSESHTFITQAVAAADIIKTYIPFRGSMFVDPANPSIKNTVAESEGTLVLGQERASSSEAWIINIETSDRPINVRIDYGPDSTKHENVLEVVGRQRIRINGGTGQDRITITGAQDDTQQYTFEIAGNGGRDTYCLDRRFNYKLVDSGENQIFIDDGAGKWINIGTLYQTTENGWKSLDEMYKSTSSRTVGIPSGMMFTPPL